MLVAKQVLMDADGNFMLSVKEDQTQYAKDVKAERENGGGWSKDRTMKLMGKIPPKEYYYWVDKLGADCWSDNDFLKFHSKHRPELYV